MRRTVRILSAAALAAMLSDFAATAPRADDRHAGYYYPQPQSFETYYARARPLDGANRDRRLGFVTGMTQRQMQAPYPMSHVVFAKGTEAEKLLIVALQDGPFDTIFRARAFLAAMTAAARATPKRNAPCCGTRSNCSSRPSRRACWSTISAPGRRRSNTSQARSRPKRSPSR